MILDSRTRPPENGMLKYLFFSSKKDVHSSCLRTDFAAELSSITKSPQWFSEAGQAKAVVNVVGKRSEYVAPSSECVRNLTDLQCDQIRPACSQCQRSKDTRPCPGYRDEEKLRFFDESSEVSRRVQDKQVNKLRKRDIKYQILRNSSGSTTSSPESDGPVREFSHDEFPVSSTRSLCVSRVLFPPLESQGIRYFLANYVMSDSDFCAGHMQNLLSSKTTRSKTLQVAMGAVGLAGLSNRWSDSTLMARARNQYAVALRMTTSHLQDPSSCLQDRTISAVALLGLFEVRFHENISRPILHILTYSNRS